MDADRATGRFRGGFVSTTWLICDQHTHFLLWAQARQPSSTIILDNWIAACGSRWLSKLRELHVAARRMRIPCGSNQSNHLVIVLAGMTEIILGTKSEISNFSCASSV